MPEMRFTIGPDELEDMIRKFIASEHGDGWKLQYLQSVFQVAPGIEREIVLNAVPLINIGLYRDRSPVLAKDST